MSVRIACCIPFCRRGTTKFPGSAEIICGPHWRLAPKALRRRLSKVRRLAKRESDPVRLQRLETLDWRLWDRIKAASTEAAMGVG